MSLPKYEHFQFEVGEFVLPAFCALHMNDDKSKKEQLHHAFLIVERMYQECPGGVQLHYLCRPQALFGSREYIRFNEIELISLASV